MKRRSTFATDLGFIAFCALATGIGYGLGARAFAAAALVGGFAGYLVLFDADSGRRHATLTRLAVGAAVGLGLSALYKAPLQLSLVLTALGAVLGYLGAKWARYV